MATACCFSGGVDATYTTLAHLEERPDLLAFWGGDIALGNAEGWRNALDHLEDSAAKLGLPLLWFRSSVRPMLEEDLLNAFTQPLAGLEWWGGFALSTSMFALAAPLAWAKGYQRLYIASSHSPNHGGRYHSNSDPSIDDCFRFCGCQVVHDAFEIDRQHKVQHICGHVKESGEPLFLRVCWRSGAGHNCGTCDKCLRTALGILAEHNRPADYGLPVSWESVAKNPADVRKTVLQNLNHLPEQLLYYIEVQQALRKNYRKSELPRSFRWFYRDDLHWQNEKYLPGRPGGQGVRPCFGQRRWPGDACTGRSTAAIPLEICWQISRPDAKRPGRRRRGIAGAAGSAKQL
jgi:hypothetical protein